MGTDEIVPFRGGACSSGNNLGSASEEIHGHSFRAEVTVRGTPDPATGMVMDLGILERRIGEVQALLDHKLLNRIETLGLPTLENLARFIWDRVEPAGQGDTRQRASRQLQRKLLLFRPPGIKLVITVIASEAKQSTAPQEEWIASSLRSSQ